MRLFATHLARHSLDAAQEKPCEPAAAVDLTRLDLDVLAPIAQGASNKTIPPSLWISVHTMKFRLASLLDKRCCRPIDPGGLSLEGGGEP